MSQTQSNIHTELAKLKVGRLTSDMFEKYTIQAYGEKSTIPELC